MTTTAAAAPPATGWRRQLPNQLTALRVALAAVVVVALALPPSLPTLTIALVAFIAGALTDAADGHLARRWNAITRFGRVMDPFADKMLVLSTVVMLAGPALHDGDRQLSGLAPWMVVVILARDLLVTSIRGVYEARGVDFSASLAGKAKMIVQSVAVPLILLVLCLTAAAPGPAARVVIDAAAWGITLVTAASAVPYVTRAIIAERSGLP